jgi:phosphate/sulfate permease
MSLELILLILVVVLAFVFDYINGFHDTANAIATSVATRVLSPAQAIVMAAVLNFAGAMVGTIGAGFGNHLEFNYLVLRHSFKLEPCAGV